MQKNFFGLAIYHPKTKFNVGSLLRTAHLLGVNFICTIGERYKTQVSDTTVIKNSIPFFEYNDIDTFITQKPNCQLIGIELSEKSRPLKNFVHPRTGIYLLGAEDYGLPIELMERCSTIIQLPGSHSMNVAVAGSIVMYHRFEQFN